MAIVRFSESSISHVPDQTRRYPGANYFLWKKSSRFYSVRYVGFRQAYCRPYQGSRLAGHYAPPGQNHPLAIRVEVVYTLNSAGMSWEIVE